MGSLVVNILVVVVVFWGGASAAGDFNRGVKQQQNTRGSHQSDNDVQAAEVVTASEVEYVEGPLDPLYDFLVDSKLQQFCKLLKDSEVEEVIVALEGPWTLFAPTDNSFVFLPDGALEELKRDPALLREFLLRHFVAGELDTQQIQQDMIVESLQSTPLRFNIYGPVLTVSGAQLLERDLLVGGGRVNVIDSPLFSSPQTDILGYLQNNHFQMYELILSTRLADYITSGTFTFLAPDDRAFDFLSTELKNAVQSNSSLAERIVLNHLLPGTLYLAGITDGLTWETVGGAVITFTTRRGFIFANDIPLEQPEVSVTNGVVQTINRILLPEGVEIDCQCKASIDDLQVPPVQTTQSVPPTRTTTTHRQVTNRPFNQSPPSRQTITQRPAGRPSTRPFNPQRIGQRPVPTSPSRIGQPPRQNTPPRSATLTVWNATPATVRQPDSCRYPSEAWDRRPLCPATSDDDSNLLVVQPERVSAHKRPDAQRVTQVSPPGRVTPPPRRPISPQRIPVSQRTTVFEPTTTENLFEGNIPGRYPDRDISDDEEGTTTSQRQSTSWFNRRPTQATARPTQRTTRRPLVTRTTPVRSSPLLQTTPALQTEPEVIVPVTPQRPAHRPQSWNQRKPTTKPLTQQKLPDSPQRRPVSPPQPQQQRRPVQPPRTPVTTTTTQSIEPNRQCRQRNEPFNPSNRNLPTCSDAEPCQKFPYDVEDPRPFCPEDIPTLGCVSPDEPFNPAERRPMCQTPLPPSPPPQPQGCRDSSDPSYPGDRRPICNDPTGCRDPAEPMRPSDRRPLCRPAIAEASCRYPSEPWDRRPLCTATPETNCRTPSEQWDRRPLCRTPVLTGCRDPSMPQDPSDYRPPCPTCREVGQPLDPNNPLPICNTNGPSFGCRRSGEASYPQDTRPFCPEENLPSEDCRPFLERPQAGDRRPVCKVTRQPPAGQGISGRVPTVTTSRGQAPHRGQPTRQPTFFSSTRQPPLVGSTRQSSEQTTRSSWQPSAGPPQRPVQPQKRPGKQPQVGGHNRFPETNEYPPDSGLYPTTVPEGFTTTFIYPSQQGSQTTQPQPGRNQIRQQPPHSGSRQPGKRPQQTITHPPRTGSQPHQPGSPQQQQPPRTGGPRPGSHTGTGQPPQTGSFQPGQQPQSGSFQPEQPPQTGSFQPGQRQPPQTGSFQPGQRQPPQTGSFQPGQRQPSQTGSFQPGQRQPPQTGSFQPGQRQPPQTGSFQPGQRQTPQTGSFQPGPRQPPQTGSFQPGQRPQTTGSQTPQTGEICVRCPNQANPQSGLPGQQVPGSSSPRRPVNPTGVSVSGRTQSTPRVPISVTGTSTTPGEDSRRSLYEIVEDPALLIRGHPVKLTKIFDLFHKAGIEDILTGQGPTTVFLPSDDAFAALPKGVIEQLEEYPDLLRQVLLYHVTNVEILPTAQGESYTVPSLQGMQLVITMLNGGRLILISGAKAIAVTRANNGIFYVINQLLYPLPYQDIVSAVRSRPDLSQLAQLLEISGLADSLQGVKPYTLFAPTDDAFAKLSPVFLEELAQNTSALQELLLNHLTDGAHYGREFISAGTLPSARGGKLKFQVVSYGYKVNDVNIKTPEIVTGTGVIHLVDQVLLEAPDRQLLNRLENSAAGANVLSTLVNDPQVIDGQQTDVANLARAMGLNRFASWVTNTGLLEKIHDGGVYTIFAPTDNAVNALPRNVADSIDSNPEQVKPLLKYHIVPQRLNLNSVSNEETASTLLEGKNIRFNVYKNDRAGCNQCKQLLTASGTPVGQELGTMGSIQVIPVNQVLYQPSGNLMGIVDSSPILQNFSKAIRNARLTWVLSGAGPFTVFAPSDTAFQSLTDEEKNNFINNRQAFTDLLQRHMIRGSLFSSGVQSDIEKKSEKGETLNISLEEGIMKVNSIPVAFSDVTASNGVLHVIDQFL